MMWFLLVVGFFLQTVVYAQLENVTMEMIGTDRYTVTAPAGLGTNATCTQNGDRTLMFCEVTSEDYQDCINLCTYGRDDCLFGRQSRNKCFIILNIVTERTCSDLGVINIKQWSAYLTGGWDTNDGLLYTWTFNKKHSFTDLHVTWIGSLRAAYNYDGAAANRWWFTFNGAIGTPPIDFANYIDRQKDFNKHGEFGGYVKNIAAGNVQIAFRVGASTSGNTVGNARTGWYSHNRVIFQEVDTRVSSGCQGLSLFNIKEYYRTNLNNGDNTGSIMEYDYNKSQYESAVRVRLVMVMRGSNSNVCTKYSIQFNGAECTNPNPINGLVAMIGGTLTEHRTANLEGICHGLPNGNVNVKVHLSSCSSHGQLDSYSGWYSTSRIQVEEVRFGLPPLYYRWNSNADNYGLLYSDEEVVALQSTVYNIRHWTWANINSELDNGVLIAPVIYNKMESASGLKIVFSATLRQYTRGACNRWFIKFNGTECSAPAHIEGHIYVNSFVNDVGNQNYHRPYTITGICNEIPAGPTEISVHVGSCHSGSIGNAYTGYLSTTVALSVEEVISSAI